MKTLKVMLLWLILFASTMATVHAQITESFTFTTNRAVPDGNLSGLADVQAVNSSIGNITSLTVRLKVAGQFNGDLYGYLRHSSGFTILLNRPGKTVANPFGYTDTGLDVSFQDAATNGDIHLYQTVLTPAAGSPLTGTWQPDGRLVDPNIVTDQSSRTTALASFNGLGASGQWTLYLVDTQSGGTNMLTEWGLDITGTATPGVTWTNPADITYGTALSETQLNATATYNSTPVTGTFSYTPAAGTLLNAGSNQTLTVVFTPDDTTDYLPVTNTVSINVQQAPLTITAQDSTMAYGQDLPSFTVTYSGFVPGEDTNNLTSLATATTSATSTSDVGSYSIVPSGASSSNYAIAYVNGTLTITQALSSGVLTSSANPALPGANVTFTETLAAVAPGGGFPDGTVNFKVDGNVVGSGTLSGGVASFSTSSLAAGSHTVTAEYAGSLDFVGTTNDLGAPQIINTPPVAGNVTIQRYPTGGTKIQLATLLASDTDADGNPLTITGVSSNSANGGTITVFSGWVIYTPAPGFTNEDSFTYTVQDSFGATAVGTVTVAIISDNSPSSNLTITSLGNNMYQIDGNGIPGVSYHLQYSDSPAPFSWLDLPDASFTASDVGQFQYIDTTTNDMRFYRSVSP